MALGYNINKATRVDVEGITSLQGSGPKRDERGKEVGGRECPSSRKDALRGAISQAEKKGFQLEIKAREQIHKRACRRRVNLFEYLTQSEMISEGKKMT